MTPHYTDHFPVEGFSSRFDCKQVIKLTNYLWFKHNQNFRSSWYNFKPIWYSSAFCNDINWGFCLRLLNLQYKGEVDTSVSLSTLELNSLMIGKINNTINNRVTWLCTANYSIGLFEERAYKYLKYIWMIRVWRVNFNGFTSQRIYVFYPYNYIFQSNIEWEIS